MSQLATNKSTAYRCLRIAEIQVLVFRSLTRRDCVSLARTCTIFYEEAMNIVWIDVNSLIPLVRCMPVDLLVLESQHSVDSSLSGSPLQHRIYIDFCKEPMASDWSAFLKHAHRVRKFGTGDSLVVGPFTWTTPNGIKHTFRHGFAHITANALQQITRFAQQRYAAKSTGLFPRLAELTAWGTIDMRLPVYLPYICGDTMTALTLSRGSSRPLEEMDGLYNTLPDILVAIRGRWPRISYVMIHTIGDLDGSDTYIEGLGIWLKSLQELQTLHACGRYRATLVQLLSELPVLQTLGFAGCQHSIADTPLNLSPSLLRRPFQSLQTLELTTYQANTLAPFLRSLGSSHALRSLSLTSESKTGHFPSVSEGPAILEAISHLLRIEILKVKFTYSHRDFGAIVEAPILDSTLFAKLFHLRRLRHLEIRGFFDVNITDEDMPDAANAWLELESIQMPWENLDDDMFFDGTQIPLLTVVGVKALYDGCPNLTTVELGVNDIIPITDGALDIPPPSHESKRTIAMEDLTLRFYPIDQTFEYRSEEHFPLVLRLMFPQVDHIQTAHIDPCLVYPTDTDDAYWDSKVQKGWQTYRNMELEEVAALLARKWGEMIAEFDLLESEAAEAEE